MNLNFDGPHYDVRFTTKEEIIEQTLAPLEDYLVDETDYYVRYDYVPLNEITSLLPRLSAIGWDVNYVESFRRIVDDIIDYNDQQPVFSDVTVTLKYSLPVHFKQIDTPKISFEINKQFDNNRFRNYLDNKIKEDFGDYERASYRDGVYSFYFQEM